MGLYSGKRGMVIHQADKLQLNLLGNFSLVHPNGFEIIIRGQRKKAFIALIALSPGKEISRDKLISKLWGKRSLAQARASLRTLLNELGKIFKDSGYELVKKNSEKHSLFIDQNIVQIDVERFAEVANSHTEERRRQVMEIYRGDLHEHCKLNEDAYQEWLAIERIQQRDLLRDTLLDLQDYYLRAAAHDQVIKIANRLLTLEKTDEKAHQALMLAFSAQGDKAAAIKQYQVCFDATMALVNEPDLMMLDEPASGLSRGERERLIELLMGLPRTTTLLLIEHDMDVALNVADRVVVLSDGEQVAVGTPAEIREDPLVHAIYLQGHQ
jgi:DNA-binding SARP family transcriptional activator